VNNEYRLLNDLLCYAKGTTIETKCFVSIYCNDPKVDVQMSAECLSVRFQKIVNIGEISDDTPQALAYSGSGFLVIDREP
jgi:hypothetical protein